MVAPTPQPAAIFVRKAGATALAFRAAHPGGKPRGFQAMQWKCLNDSMAKNGYHWDSITDI